MTHQTSWLESTGACGVLSVISACEQQVSGLTSATCSAERRSLSLIRNKTSWQSCATATVCCSFQTGSPVRGMIRVSNSFVKSAKDPGAMRTYC